MWSLQLFNKEPLGIWEFTSVPMTTVTVLKRLDQPLSCAEVPSEYGISWADFEINHHAAPQV